MDQCSIGICGINFLKKQLHLAVEPLYDSCHRISNDVWNGFVAAGVFHIVPIMKICWNLNWGPWDTAKWFRHAQESLASALNSGAAGPLRAFFDSLLPAIARDMGNPAKIHEPGFGESLWSGLQKSPAVACKGPRMALCQWFSWYKAALFWDPQWHQRTFILVVWGLSAGYITGDASTRRLGAMKMEAKVSAHEGEVRTKKAQEATASSIRQQGRNTMHLVTLVHMMGWPLQRKLRILMIAARASHRQYAAGHKNNRGEEGSISFAKSRAGGSALQYLADTFRETRDAEAMRFMGIDAEEGDILLAGSSEASIDDECDHAVFLMHTMFCVVGAALVSNLWWSEGMPGVLPDLLQREKCASRVAWLKARESGRAADGPGGRGIASAAQGASAQRQKLAPSTRRASGPMRLRPARRE